MNKKKIILYISVVIFSFLSIIFFIGFEQQRPIISFVVLNLLCVIAAMRAIKDYF